MLPASFGSRQHSVGAGCRYFHQTEGHGTPCLNQPTAVVASLQQHRTLHGPHSATRTRARHRHRYLLPHRPAELLPIPAMVLVALKSGFRSAVSRVGAPVPTGVASVSSTSCCAPAGQLSRTSASHRSSKAGLSTTPRCSAHTACLDPDLGGGVAHWSGDHSRWNRVARCCRHRVDHASVGP